MASRALVLMILTSMHTSVGERGDLELTGSSPHTQRLSRVPKLSQTLGLGPDSRGAAGQVGVRRGPVPGSALEPAGTHSQEVNRALAKHSIM